MKEKQNGADFPQEEKRQWVRHNIYIPLKLKGKDKEGRVVSEFAFTVNISAGGALILSLSDFDTDEELELSIEPAYYMQPLARRFVGHQLPVRVVRVDRDIKGFSGGNEYGLGVSFPKEIDYIEDLRAAFGN